MACSDAIPWLVARTFISDLGSNDDQKFLTGRMRMTGGMTSEKPLFIGGSWKVANGPQSTFLDQDAIHYLSWKRRVHPFCFFFLMLNPTYFAIEGLFRTSCVVRMFEVRQPAAHSVRKGRLIASTRSGAGSSLKSVLFGWAQFPS